MSNIVRALRKLDVSNDDHWTGEGLPRLDVVAELTKQKNVTRSEVNAAAPYFTRENPLFKLEDATGELTKAADEEVQPEEIDETPDSVLSVLEQQLAEADEQLAVAEAALQKALKVKQEVDAARDAILIKRTKNFNQHENQIAIMEFLESQKRAREKRVAILNPVVPQSAKSILDQSLALRAKPKRPGLKKPGG